MRIVAVSHDDIVLLIRGRKFYATSIDITRGTDASEPVRDGGAIVGKKLGVRKLVTGTLDFDKHVFDDLEAEAVAAGKSIQDFYPFPITYSFKEVENADGYIAKTLSVTKTKTISDCTLYEDKVSSREGDKGITVSVSFDGIQ